MEHPLMRGQRESIVPLRSSSKRDSKHTSQSNRHSSDTMGSATSKNTGNRRSLRSLFSKESWTKTVSKMPSFSRKGKWSGTAGAEVAASNKENRPFAAKWAEQLDELRERPDPRLYLSKKSATVNNMTASSHKNTGLFKRRSLGNLFSGGGVRSPLKKRIRSSEAPVDAVDSNPAAEPPEEGPATPSNAPELPNLKSSGSFGADFESLTGDQLRPSPSSKFHRNSSGMDEDISISQPPKKLPEVISKYVPSGNGLDIRRCRPPRTQAEGAAGSDPDCHPKWTSDNESPERQQNQGTNIIAAATNDSSVPEGGEERVAVVFPSTEDRDGHTDFFGGKQDAITALYSQRETFSERALFDPQTNTFYAQLSTGTIFDTSANKDGLELINLSMRAQSFNLDNGARPSSLKAVSAWPHPPTSDHTTICTEGLQVAAKLKQDSKPIAYTAPTKELEDMRQTQVKSIQQMVQQKKLQLGLNWFPPTIPVSAEETLHASSADLLSREPILETNNSRIWDQIHKETRDTAKLVTVPGMSSNMISRRRRGSRSSCCTDWQYYTPEHTNARNKAKLGDKCRDEENSHPTGSSDGTERLHPSLGGKKLKGKAKSLTSIRQLEVLSRDDSNRRQISFEMDLADGTDVDVKHGAHGHICSDEEGSVDRDDILR